MTSLLPSGQRGVLYGLLLGLLSACSSSSTDSVETVELTAKSPNDTDMLIAEALYFDRRTPSDFEVSIVADTGFYTLSHIKSTDIMPPVARVGEAVFELAANDFVEALNLSEQMESHNAVYRDLVDSIETDIYYQFTRIDMNEPDVSHYVRVFKQAVIDRADVDLSVSDRSAEVYVGRMSLEAISSTRLKQVVEYLWAFSLDNNYGNAVIETGIQSGASILVYRLKEARLTLSYGQECDLVTLYDTDYSLNRNTGTITKTVLSDRSFSSRRDGMLVSLCDE